MIQTGLIQEGEITLNGQKHSFRSGETILEVANRAGVEIPTLCHDPRLKPAGACRTCLVEVEGQRRLLPACATKATTDMAVVSENERVDRHRKTLLGLYATDHPTNRESSERGAPDELLDMIETYRAPTDWGNLASVRSDRHSDRNPYINFEPDTCILCARCTRYCDEVEAVSAITLAGRGSETTISTVDWALAARHLVRAVRRLHRRLPDRGHGREAAAHARRQARARAREGAHDLQLLRSRLPARP